MKAAEIFTPGSYPTWTFVDDHLQDKGKQVCDVLNDGFMLISIAGPSKSGKTVFVEHVIGEKNLIQLACGGIRSSGEFWNRLFYLIGIPISHSSTSGTTQSGTIGLKSSAEGNLLVAKVSGELSGSGTYSEQFNESQSTAIDYLQLLINKLSKTNVVIFIDDFHYLNEEIKSDLAQQIKEAIRHGVKFICASVPYHSDDVIRSNPDLRGRIFSIDFNYWGIEFLKKIADKGFAKANIECDEILINHLVEESAGSPQLMQYLCLNLCHEIGVNEISRQSVKVLYSIPLIRNICRHTVQSIDFSSIVNKMIEGPKIRGANRKIYMSKLGWQGDVYTFLLKALSLDPPQLTFRYQSLVDRISSICIGDVPSGSSITSACDQASMIANDSAKDIIVEWDSENDVFDIRDPYLLFYLRWADIIG